MPPMSVTAPAAVTDASNRRREIAPPPFVTAIKASAADFAMSRSAIRATDAQRCDDDAMTKKIRGPWDGPALSLGELSPRGRLRRNERYRYYRCMPTDGYSPPPCSDKRRQWISSRRRSLRERAPQFGGCPALFARAQPERRRHRAEHARILDVTAEHLRARPHRGQDHVVGRVHALFMLNGKLPMRRTAPGSAQFLSLATNVPFCSPSTAGTFSPSRYGRVVSQKVRIGGEHEREAA